MRFDQAAARARRHLAAIASPVGPAQRLKQALPQPITRTGAGVRAHPNAVPRAGARNPIVLQANDNRCAVAARGRRPARARPSVAGPRRQRAPGFTVLELMFVIAIAAVIAVVAVGQYSDYVDRAKIAAAKADILVMGLQIQRHRNDKGAYPASLADIGRGNQLDPWQRPYHYTDLSGKGGKGKARKDHKLNPLNSDFDLFSAGKDGQFKTQVDHKLSRDDVIRARDGSFVDVAEKF